MADIPALTGNIHCPGTLVNSANREPIQSHNNKNCLTYNQDSGPVLQGKEPMKKHIKSTVLANAALCLLTSFSTQVFAESPND